MGNRLWNRTWGGTGDEQGNGVAIGLDGSIYMVGSTNNLSGRIDTDGFIAKFSNAGILEWYCALGFARDDAAFGVAISANGNIVITGSTCVCGSFGYLSIQSYVTSTTLQAR